LVFLNKDSGKTAIPSNHIYIGSGSGHTGHAGLVVEGVDSVSSQLDPAVVITFNQDNNTEEVKTGWVEFAMNGHSQTVGGLDSPETQRTGPLNAISNTCTLAAAMGFADYPRPTTTGTLTIKTVNAGDDYTYSGRIFNGFEGDLPLSIVKDGPGTQRFVPGIDATDGVYSYTGGTTVKAGKLDVGAVGKFTPNAPVSVEGGELALGDAYDQVFSSVALKTGMLTGSKTVASTSDFDMQAGLATVGLAGDVGLVKTTAGTVTLAGPLTYSGNTEVQAGTLEIAGDATLTTVTGADVGTLKVCDGSSLTATSIQVGTLVIGGTPTYTAPPAPAAVPEPSTFVLLVLASLAFAWFWRRKL
jgi:autotransporter-associated beta strand protein